MTNYAQFAKIGKKIIGATTNYVSMLEVLNIKCPAKPTIFLKPSTSYITEEECIKIPKGFSVNQEVELGVIIKTKCRNVQECEAMDVIAGYCVALDMTATCQMKEARNRGLPWLLGKGFDTACPVSKFIPKNCIDLNNVPLWCCVNDEVRQNGNTCDFIFPVPTLIAYITQYVTLEPCDLIITGTPPGMGPVKPGDVIYGGIKNVISFEFNVACG